MTIEVNGQTVTVPADTNTVGKLLHHLKLESKIVVVEKNRQVLEREQQHEVPLHEGDRLEIVQFVGGG
jgi:sulfur carrier protein